MNRRASLVVPWIRNNQIFELNNPLNRDNCFLPYAMLKDEFYNEGIELNTSDLNLGQSVAFELHMDARGTNLPREQCYLIQFETPLIHLANGDPLLFKRFKRIFTWDDDRVDGQQWIKLNMPNCLAPYKPDGYENRLKLCCMIAGNKASAVADDRELYSERVTAIRWFESNALTSFSLYGTDWHVPAKRAGTLGRIEAKVYKLISSFGGVSFDAFPSYQGKVANKSDVLSKHCFAICYENAKGFSGYITEKIFDCFLAGCVPVYWGADNICTHIPAECFIDRRDFKDYHQLFSYMSNMPESRFLHYQEAIAQFLSSAASYAFTAQEFVKTIVTTAKKDFNEQK